MPERAAPSWWISTVFLAVALGAFGWFVWPTPWEDLPATGLHAPLT